MNQSISKIHRALMVVHEEIAALEKLAPGIKYNLPLDFSEKHPSDITSKLEADLNKSLLRGLVLAKLSQEEREILGIR